MNRNLSIAGILLYGVVIILTLAEIVGYLFVGDSLFRAESYSFWLNAWLLAFFLADLVMLKYFHFKKYLLAFFLLAFHEIVFHIYFFSELNQLSALVRHTFLFATLATGILLDLSLLLSPASERPLLKQAGKLGLVLGVVATIVHSFWVTSSDGATITALDETLFWISAAGNFIIVFFLLNFYQELRSAEKVSLS